MRLLGAVLAGGQSRRFGSDKAEALVGNMPLLDLVADAVAAQVDELIIVGRTAQGRVSVADHPSPGLGPLGGLCGALRHAENKFDAVLTAGCDVLPVPADLVERLTPGPALISGQPLFGLWPAALYRALLEHLDHGGDRSLRRWADSVGAREVKLDVVLHNLNTPADLALYRRLHEGDAGGR